MKRDEEEKRELATRLNKIEGQIRGIQKMIDEDRYCIDVLTQVSAARAALDKIALQILKSHTRGCIADAIRNERGDKAIDELVLVLDKFLK
jgi:CsoR family transcriptional regulator, copper-sensing transcriptional repressor